MRERGKVKWFDPGKGFGFITRDGDGPDAFVHYSAISEHPQALDAGDIVEFTTQETSRGPRAVGVVRIAPVEG